MTIYIARATHDETKRMVRLERANRRATHGSQSDQPFPVRAKAVLTHIMASVEHADNLIAARIDSRDVRAFEVLAVANDGSSRWQMPRAQME